MTNRNIGKFTIDGFFLETKPETIAEVFALLKIVPVRCEFLHYMKKFEYIAISEKFKKIPEGMCVPEYELKIEMNKDGRVYLVEIIPL